MKKRLVRIIAVVLCLVMCIGLTGCAESLSAMLTVKKTYRAIEETQSLSFDVKGTANGTSNGEPLVVRLNGSCDWVLDPFTMKIDTTVSLKRMGRLNVPMYIAMEGEKLVLYFGLGLGSSDEPVWMAVDIKTDGEDAQIDIASVIAMFENSTQPISKSEEEELEESTVIPLTLELPGKLLMNSISGKGQHKSMMDNITIDLTVDKETNLPTHISADLAPLLKYIIAESGFGFYPDLKIDSVPVELTVTGVDSIESITLPDMTVNGAAVTLPAAETEKPVVVTTPEPTDAPEEKAE